MYNTNDERIKLTIDKIDSKIHDIKKIRKEFKTNLQFYDPDFAKMYNFHVLNIDELKKLMVRLHVYEMSAKDLGIDYVVGGYSIADWVSDINTLLAIKAQDKYIADLESAKANIEDKLSEDAKLSDFIDSIETMLGE